MAARCWWCPPWGTANPALSCQMHTATPAANPLPVHQQTFANDLLQR